MMIWFLLHFRWVREMRRVLRDLSMDCTLCKARGVRGVLVMLGATIKCPRCSYWQQLAKGRCSLT